IPNPVTFNNSTITVTGSNNLTFGGAITLTDTGMAAGIFTNTVTVNNTAQTVFAGAMSGAGSLLLAGSGNVFLSGNNTYAGNTFLTGNLLIAAASDSAFGAGTLVMTTGTLLAD